MRTITKRRRQALLACLLAVCGSVLALAASAVAATPESVTITADEFFGASGDTVINLEATGGIFGTGITTGTGESFQQTKGSVNSTTHRLPLVIHGVDVYTFGANAITFNWQFTCVYSSLTDAVCSGPWHITSGTGAYEGAKGGGTAVDLCTDEYNGPGGAYSATVCSDTLTGKIQAP